MAIELQKLELTGTHLFNLGGVMIVGLGVAMMAVSSFKPPPEMPLCEARYAGGVLFSYSRQNGVPLAPEDLQARMGGLDRGLVQNARVVQDGAVPLGYALEIRLKKAMRAEDEQSRSGIGFTWMPRNLSAATAVCLSYSVWTPPDFKPGEGGALPGLVSESLASESTDAKDPAEQSSHRDRAEQPESSDGEKSAANENLPPFSLRPQWRPDGSLMLWNQPNIGQRGAVVLDPQKAALRPGHWVRIETEIVLNSPGNSDGILRAWVDGKLVQESTDIGFRKDEMQSFQAILGDVHNLRGGAWAASPVDTRLRLSPLELRLGARVQ